MKIDPKVSISRQIGLQMDCVATENHVNHSESRYNSSLGHYNDPLEVQTEKKLKIHLRVLQYITKMVKLEPKMSILS